MKMPESQFRRIGSVDVRFWPGGPGGRWVFTGSRNAGGYATVEDAMVEATAQVEGKAQGLLAHSLGRVVTTADHRRFWREHIDPLVAKR